MCDLTPEAQDAVVQLLQFCLKQEDDMLDAPEYRYISKSINEPEVSYAIHNSELNLLKEASTVAAALYFLVENPVAIVGGLVVLLFEYRRKRIRLTGEQGLALKTLRQAKPPGWSTEQLLKQLPLSGEFSVAHVQSILDNLKSVTRTDGSETSLVREKDGLWFVIDV